MNKTQIVILFILIGYLMTCFSKNMVIVLLVPLVLVNLLTSGIMMKEGFTEGFDCKEGEKYDEEQKKCVPIPVEPKPEPAATEPAAAEPAAAEPAPAKKDGFASAGARKGGSRVDMGSTLEQAYDDLNSVLGSDGIKNLTSDTQNLMKQQLHLAEAMKEMGPLMQQAQSMLKTLNIDGLGDLPSLIKKFGVNANAPK